MTRYLRLLGYSAVALGVIWLLLVLTPSSLPKPPKPLMPEVPEFAESKTKNYEASQVCRDGGTCWVAAKELCEFNWERIKRSEYQRWHPSDMKVSRSQRFTNNCIIIGQYADMFLKSSERETKP